MTGSDNRIAADVGGTFTDVAAFDAASGRLTLGKSLTTPDRIVDGIGHATTRAGSRFAGSALFLHGSTIAINVMLERNGARTALVTTRGFRDVYEIGRVNRPDAYHLFFRKHRPLVERALRFEVDERINAAGEPLKHIDFAELEAIARRLEAERVEALAILFLHSYRNPSHEIAARRFFQRRLPALFVSASHELSQEYREFERTSTVVANAYIGKKVERYLGEVEGYLEQARFPGRFLVVQSSGGLFEGAQARRECIRMLESGPAAGVIGTQALCATLGLDRAIAFDMGGTTAKAGVVLHGKALMANNVMVGGYAEGLPIQVPMIDIQEVGTGGGSIARLGAGNALRVGPQSAGARPGPVCYGLGGTEPTVTDANLLLGRLSAGNFLGGDMRLDVERAQEAMARLAGSLSLSVEAAADGILRIAVASMANVVKRVTTERGLDARDFPMVSYGGAGPLHAVLVARELQIRQVIVPNAPGHFSAFGMLVADLRRDFVRTVFTRLANAPFDAFSALLDEAEAAGRADMRGAAIAIRYGADMRYIGQEHAVTVDFAGDFVRGRDAAAIKAAFDAAHEERYGYASPDEGAEIVSLRLSIIGELAKPSLPRIERGPLASPQQRPVYFTQAGFVPTKVFSRAALRAGNRFEGPALVEEYGSTTVVPPGARLEVDQHGNLLIEVHSG
ncbi:MAG TPA: hydantoinase/oxoprolinase family protein [Burkholderiales bacterium]|nr:hydantoinase/oxoprolinase family protein [Burkholderiales bacterium]